MMRLLSVFLFLACSLAFGNVPMRDCTLKAPVADTGLSAAQVAPYQQGSQAVLKVKGFLFPPGTNKTIDADPTEENNTALRTAINYHRSLKTQGLDEIVQYWHPALQKTKQAQLSQPGVMDDTKALFANLSSVELLGMLEIQGREVVFIRYSGKTHAYVTVESNGVYYLVSDPGLTPQTKIATAAFDTGAATMASR
ncbi:hypothetical protein [Cerasicoccus frondis]|uniref:hypothetical protein n=1 Tax=Cerasicoccus frondis TaxID=490090 RepID=UPI002852BE7A|nr:hypothetical protein [Cerasicoccus frondis]